MLNRVVSSDAEDAPKVSASVSFVIKANVPMSDGVTVAEFQQREGELDDMLHRSRGLITIDSHDRSTMLRFFPALA